MMHADAAQVYEGWRRLWLTGGDSNAIAALRYHGLRGALAMTGSACSHSRPPLPRSADAELPVAEVAITEAASQVRHLLRAASPAAVVGTTREHGENSYV